ncbi:hypothetical protein KCP78_25685 [Salmonella enterica subsp. enterica]|nr:hypothetical protein KCP78_25685 [Salmonella enterica subsp. enterica]
MNTRQRASGNAGKARHRRQNCSGDIHPGRTPERYGFNQPLRCARSAAGARTADERAWIDGDASAAVTPVGAVFNRLLLTKRRGVMPPARATAAQVKLAAANRRYLRCAHPAGSDEAGNA